MKEHRASYIKEYRAQHPEKWEYTRAGHIRRRYGLSVEQLDAMVLAQCGQCAICGEVGDLQIDHDHVTGAVRGLLCHKCNKVLGLVNDESQKLRRAMDYLGVAA